MTLYTTEHSIVTSTCSDVITPGLLASVLSSRLGARATISIGSALCVLGFLVPYTATSFWTVFLFYGIVAGRYMTCDPGSLYVVRKVCKNVNHAFSTFESVLIQLAVR